MVSFVNAKTLYWQEDCDVNPTGNYTSLGVSASRVLTHDSSNGYCSVVIDRDGVGGIFQDDTISAFNPVTQSFNWSFQIMGKDDQGGDFGDFGSMGFIEDTTQPNFTSRWFGFRSYKFAEPVNAAFFIIKRNSTGTSKSKYDSYGMVSVDSWYNVDIVGLGNGSWYMDIDQQDGSEDYHIDGFELEEDFNTSTEWSFMIEGMISDSASASSSSKRLDNMTLYVEEQDGGSSCTNMTITATDVDSNSLQGFYANVSYNGTTTTWSDTAGTITTDICTEDQLLANITWYNDTWFDDVELEHNTTSNYVADDLYQAKVQLFGNEIISNNTVTPEKVYVDGSERTTCATSVYCMVARDNEIILENSSYVNNITENVSIVASQISADYYLTPSFYETVLNVSMKYINGTYITDYYVNISSDNETYINNTVATAQDTLFYLLFGDYNITMDAQDVTSNNSLINIYTDYYSHVVTVYLENSINFTFYDEETGLVIDDRNVTAELIGDSFSYNYTTAGGNFWATLLYPDGYIIRYFADEYDERYYYFNLLDDSVNWLDLYLGNSSNTVTVTATVYDEGSFPLEDAQIRVLRYDLPTNSYSIYEMCETTWDGTCLLHLIPEDEWYKYYIYYEGTLEKETTAQILPTGITTLAFQITTGDDPTEDYFNSLDVTYSLGFDDVNDRFRYYWNDNNAVASQGCLEVFRENSLGSVLINSTCTDGATGTVYIGVDNVTDTTYRAVATVWFSNSEQFIDSSSYTYRDYDRFGSFGLFIIAILVIIFAMVGIWNPIVASILTPMPLLFGEWLGFTSIGWGYIIPIQVLGIFIAFIISKRS